MEKKDKFLWSNLGGCDEKKFMYLYNKICRDNLCLEIKKMTYFLSINNYFVDLLRPEIKAKLISLILYQ